MQEIRQFSNRGPHIHGVLFLHATNRPLLVFLRQNMPRTKLGALVNSQETGVGKLGIILIDSVDLQWLACAFDVSCAMDRPRGRYVRQAGVHVWQGCKAQFDGDWANGAIRGCRTVRLAIQGRQNCAHSTQRRQNCAQRRCAFAELAWQREEALVPEVGVEPTRPKDNGF